MEKVQDLNGQWFQNNNGCYRMQQRSQSHVDAGFHYYHHAYPTAVVPGALQGHWFQQWNNLAPVFNQQAAAHLQGRASGGSPTNKNEGEKDTEDPWGMVEAQAAFLGPSLWDNSDLKMEYMDLDEFLSENGIPLTETEVNSSAPTSPSTSSTTSAGNNGKETRATNVPNKPISPADLLDSESVSSVASSCGSMRNAVAPATVSVTPPRPTASGAGKRKGRQPVLLESDDDDEDEDVPVRKNGRKEDDLALASLPGETFDPRCRTFSEEELRPQPMVKKSKKQYVPEDLKDDKYWSRRQKNNMAAKRSRDARRTKENQIIMRASFLEKENTGLKAQLEKMKKENSSLKQRLQKYERV